VTQRSTEPVDRVTVHQIGPVKVPQFQGFPRHVSGDSKQLHLQGNQTIWASPLEGDQVGFITSRANVEPAPTQGSLNLKTVTMTNSEGTPNLLQQHLSSLFDVCT